MADSRFFIGQGGRRSTGHQEKSFGVKCSADVIILRRRSSDKLLRAEAGGPVNRESAIREQVIRPVGNVWTQIWVVQPPCKTGGRPPTYAKKCIHDNDNALTPQPKETL
jgi:hypothetical protein